MTPFIEGEYGEPWYIDRALPPYLDQVHVIHGRGNVGRMFSSKDQELELRAIRCVNALKGVSDDVLCSDWFRKLMHQFASQDFQTAARRAYVAVSSHLEAVQEASQKEQRFDKKLRLSGRAAGLTFAMRCIERIPTARK